MNIILFYIVVFLIVAIPVASFVSIISSTIGIVNLKVEGYPNHANFKNGLYHYVKFIEEYISDLKDILKICNVSLKKYK